MIATDHRKLLGFLDLDLGGMEVRVPVRSANPMVEPELNAPLVSLECHGSRCEIIVRGEADSKAVNEGVEQVAEQALRHLSRKLLN